MVVFTNMYLNKQFLLLLSNDGWENRLNAPFIFIFTAATKR